MTNFAASLINSFVQAGHALNDAIMLSFDVDQPEIKCGENRLIRIKGEVFSVFRGGPDQNPWFNFKHIGTAE